MSYFKKKTEKTLNFIRYLPWEVLQVKNAESAPIWHFRFKHFPRSKNNFESMFLIKTCKITDLKNISAELQTVKKRGFPIFFSENNFTVTG